MWIWIIIIAVAVGAILGSASSDKGEKGEGAMTGAIGGGVMAIGCLVKIAVAAISIFVVLWLFNVLFG